MASDQDRRIGERAYAIWIERGRPDGTADQDWMQAEQELLASTEAGPPDAASPAEPDKEPSSAPAGKTAKGAATKADSETKRKGGGKTRSDPPKGRGKK